jgi:hypothetical protein
MLAALTGSMPKGCGATAEIPLATMRASDSQPMRLTSLVLNCGFHVETAQAVTVSGRHRR